MKKESDMLAASQQKVAVTERSLLVAPRQSKKLADMRKRLQPELKAAAVQLSEKPQQLFPNLKPEVAAELSKARMLIDDRIAQIMHSFPEGKKNRLFGFRYGSVDAVKAKNIKTAFKTLGINDNLMKMKLIAEMDYHGNPVEES
ncbi:MAG: hypothetical protein ACXV8I_09990 [Methylobacter sp.]